MTQPNLTPVCRRLVAAGLLAASLPVLAQNAPAPAPAASAPENRVQSSQEIVVTAQKIAQPVLKTPVTLTAVTGEDLKAAGVNDALSLADTVPGLWISQDTGKAQIAIRGVTSTDMTEKGDGSAAFHVDGAYISRGEAQLGGFFDIDRVEVLRGPQGTLYGRNATAGAINVITARPEKTFSARLGVDIGNYSALRTDGMINVPLGDTLALRAAVHSARHDTYLLPGPNTATRLESQSDYAGRVHLLANLSKDTSLLLTAETQHSGGGGSSPVPVTNFFSGTPVGNLPFSPAGRGNNISNPVYVDRGSEAQRTTAWEFPTTYRAGSPLAGQPIVSMRDQDADILRAELKTTLGNGIDLNYQLAYVTVESASINNGNFFGFPFFSSIVGSAASTSHELRFSKATGDLRWVAGLYVFDEDIDRTTDYNTYVTLPNGFPLTVHLPFKPHIENKSKAVFGQTTWSLRPETRLTLGLRYTRDTKNGVDPLGGEEATGGSTTSPGAYSKSVSFSNTNYRVGIDQDLGKNAMVFAAVSTGYKAGGFNDTSDGGDYKPETLRSAEVGLKGRFFDDNLQLATTVFDYDYRDLQLASVICPDGTPASCGSVTTNAAKARIRGAEFEGWLNVGKNGRVNFGVALTDAKFKDYKPVDRPVNNPTLVVDWSGQRLDKAPPVTINVGYTHVFSLGSGADVVLNVGTRHTGKYYVSTSDDGAIRYTQPATRKSDLSVTYNDAGGKWSLQGYVKNIEDVILIGTKVPGAFAVSEPRTFGVRANYHF